MFFWPRFLATLMGPRVLRVWSGRKLVTGWIQHWISSSVAPKGKHSLYIFGSRWESTYKWLSGEEEQSQWVLRE